MDWYKSISYKLYYLGNEILSLTDKRNLLIWNVIYNFISRGMTGHTGN